MENSMHDRFLHVRAPTQVRWKFVDQRNRFGDEREFQDFVHVLDEVNREILLNRRWNIGQILLVILRKNHDAYSSPMSREQLFLYASDWKHLPSQRDFPRHR